MIASVIRLLWHLAVLAVLLAAWVLCLTGRLIFAGLALLTRRGNRRVAIRKGA